MVIPPNRELGFVPHPESADRQVRLQLRQAHSLRAGDTPLSQFCSGIAEGRAVSNNSAKRAARGIRFPFADRDLAEQGGVVSEVSAARTPVHDPEVISRRSEQFCTDTPSPSTL